MISAALAPTVRGLLIRVTATVAALAIVMAWSSATPNADAAVKYRKTHCLTHCYPNQ